MKQNHFEIAVGFFVLAATVVVCLATLLYLAGFWGKHKYVVYADFASVAGVKVGDPVEIAGVRIGHVNSMALQRSRAWLGLRIRDGVTLHRDATATIVSRSLLTGDKFVEIQPGDAPRLLQPHERIASTVPPYDMTDLLITQLMTGGIGPPS